MDISGEEYILTSRIVNRIHYKWEPYYGEVFYKIEDFSKSEFCIFFLASSPISRFPLRIGVQMKFEEDFPGYLIDRMHPIYNDRINRFIYKCTIYSVDEETLNRDKLEEMIINHPDYILNESIWVR